MTCHSKNLIGIAFNLPVRDLYFYLVPESLKSSVQIGKRVLVPLRNSKKVGIIATELCDAQIQNPKEIIEILDASPILNKDIFELLKWTSNYYHYPLGRAINTALPKGIWRTTPLKDPLKEDVLTFIKDDAKIKGKKRELLDIIQESHSISLVELKKKIKAPKANLDKLIELGLISTRQEETLGAILWSKKVERDFPPQLNKHQETAVTTITDTLFTNKHQTFLLFGITGSGKTEVYMRVIDKALNLGKDSIVIVPEISLTPQLINRFRARFGDNISVLHSNLSDKERFGEWQKIKKGLSHIVIGARSAIFAPVNNLGVIIVDEEHDTSFKQENQLMYNGANLACVRGQISNSVVILGSATPSLETYKNALSGKFKLLELPERISGRALPIVEIIDMKNEEAEFGEKPILSKRLIELIEENLVKKFKTLLFLNRRGFAPFVVCSSCGYIEKCPNCSVSLTYHKRIDRLSCHYCLFEKEFSPICPACGKISLSKVGIGTEKLEEELKQMFPEAKVARMDSDTTKGRTSHEQILGELIKGKTDILLGTQMITKGLDIPEVTLVGVIYADMSLSLPDFRAAERTFQLITQVSGRAGRGKFKGKVIVQTYNPEHYSIISGCEQNFIKFFTKEDNFRKELDYPPYTKITLIRVSGLDALETVKAAKKVALFAKKLTDANKEFNENITFLGPAPCPITKLSGKTRWQMLIKCTKPAIMNRYVHEIDKFYFKNIRKSPVHFKIDVDPVSFL